MAAAGESSDTSSRSTTVLHLFYRIEFGAWSLLAPEEQIAAKTNMSELIHEIRTCEGAFLQFFGIISPKADIGFIMADTDVHRAHEFEKRLSLSLGPDILSPVYSFFSLIHGDCSLDLGASLSQELEVMSFFPGCIRNSFGADPVGAQNSPVNVGELQRRVKTTLLAGSRVSGLVTCSAGLDDAEMGVTIFADGLSDVSVAASRLHADSQLRGMVAWGDCYAGLNLSLDGLFRRVQI